MHIRLTITLLGLLTLAVASGCSTNTSSTPNVLILSVYQVSISGPVQQWTITNTSFVEPLYTQALALPQVFTQADKITEYSVEYVFKHDSTVVLHAEPSGFDLVITGTLRDRTPTFRALTNQAICGQTPSSMFCAQSSLTPTP